MKKKVFREKYEDKVIEKMIEETEAKTVNIPKVSEVKDYKKKSDK